MAICRGHCPSAAAVASAPGWDASPGVRPVAVVCCGWVKRLRQPRALLAGYPLAEVPRRDRIEGPLASSCETSVLDCFDSSPPRTAPAHLLAFLGELRTFMDGADALAALRSPRGPASTGASGPGGTSAPPTRSSSPPRSDCSCWRQQAQRDALQHRRERIEAARCWHSLAQGGIDPRGTELAEAMA